MFSLELPVLRQEDSSTRFCFCSCFCFGRLRKGPFEGPATVKPPALPVDTYILCRLRDRSEELLLPSGTLTPARYVLVELNPAQSLVDLLIERSEWYTKSDWLVAFFERSHHAKETLLECAAPWAIDERSDVIQRCLQFKTQQSITAVFSHPT
jgi:hypothetical protein